MSEDRTAYLVIEPDWDSARVLMVATSKVVAAAYIQARPDLSDLFIDQQDMCATTSEAIALAEEAR